MKLTFGIVKNKNGYQAECLENPGIIACGWTWEQLINTIIDHTEAWGGEIKKSEYNANPPGDEIYCGYVTVEVDSTGKARILEEKSCE